MNVAVLGCGPAGLLAAYAAEELGHQVTILSRKQKSEMFGAMYLHEPIPGLCDDEPEFQVQVTKIGSRAGYANNVYGDPGADVSWDKFEDGLTPAWSLSSLYRYLWSVYEDKIVDVTLGPTVVRDLAKEYERTFSSIPARLLCENWHHSFTSAHIWVIHGHVKATSGNMMVYNGLPYSGLPSWYRYSLIQGYQSWEFSSRHTQATLTARSVLDHLTLTEGWKPLLTNCDCHPEITRIGRFGKWDKHVFTHHSYFEVQDALLPVR